MDLKALSLALGLSPTTVSRALNGYPDVSDLTRARVIEAATRLGYRPNASARRLALGRADAVGMVYPPDRPVTTSVKRGSARSGLPGG